MYSYLFQCVVYAEVNVSPSKETKEKIVFLFVTLLYREHKRHSSLLSVKENRMLHKIMMIVGCNSHLTADKSF